MNKFILLPYDIYKGLMFNNSQSDHLNLDFARKAVEKAKNELGTDPSAKNIHYNQELRRYLHLKKELDDKPVKVDVSNFPQPSSARASSPAPSASESLPTSVRGGNGDDPTTTTVKKKQPIKSTPRTSKRIGGVVLTKQEKEMYNSILDIINAEPQNFGVEGNKIQNTNGRKITGSNLKKSLYCLIGGSRWNELTPPGTKDIEQSLLQNPITRNIFEEKQSGSGFINRLKEERKIITKFRPKLWRQQLRKL